MATDLRNQNELLALRIRLLPGRSESSVLFDFYRGREQLRESVRIPAHAFGIPMELSYQEAERRMEHFFPPALNVNNGGLEEFGDALNQLVVERSWDEPLWLQISHGSNYLAIVPWESVLRGLIASDLPIFRIPNFLVDPHFLAQDMRLAICASSPSAKISYQSAKVVHDIVEMLTGTFSAADVHIFADDSVQDDLSNLARGQGGFRVAVHDPNGAAEFGLGDTTLRERSTGIASPWLRWMEQELGSRRTDLVHFVSPGYFTTNLGGLALAHSPLGDKDRRRPTSCHRRKSTRFSTSSEPGQLHARSRSRSVEHRRPYPLLSS